MSLIEINLAIMLGKPVIKETRITVELILSELGAGKSTSDLLKAYPNLTKQAVEAALQFSADAIKGEQVYQISQ